jgi:tRNA dimethylallyltransferase
MYINALVEGYNEIPNISAKIRRESRDLYIKVGPEDFFNHLKSLDPAAVRLNNNDQQRMLRAYEVVVQTGQSIFSFRNQNKTKLLSEFNFKSYFLYPERNFLYASCDQRLRKIFASGAITEVQNLYNMPIGSAKKALGFREIADYLDNKITLDEAINNAQNKTRRYAKRQITWFKNQLKEKIIFKYSNLEEFYVLNVN